MGLTAFNRARRQGLIPNTTTTEARDDVGKDAPALGEPQGGLDPNVEQPNPPPAAPGKVDPPATAGDTAEPAPPAGGTKGRKAK